MEHLRITPTSDEFHIEGFPDAVKVIQLTGNLPRRLADLSLHASDLRFAAQCLDAINQVSDEPSVIRESLWRSAIIFYVKCFSTENRARRSALSFKAVYKNALMARDAFHYFKNLRNKHLVHDENSYSQALPGAVLNHREAVSHIAKVVCITVTAATLNQGDQDNLYNLIHEALVYAESQYDDICNQITSDLEPRSYEELEVVGSPTYMPPALDEIDKTRKT